MKPHKRTNKRSADEDYIKLLYDEILIYCENEDIDFSGYNQNTNPFLAELQNTIGFSIINDMKDAQTGKVDTFYYTASGGKVKSLFKHFRNALAHNRLFAKQGDKGIIIEDVYKGHLSMYAEVSSCEKLKNIISSIKAKKK
jgi:hypothetical protein